MLLSTASKQILKIKYSSLTRDQWLVSNVLSHFNLFTIFMSQITIRGWRMGSRVFLGMLLVFHEVLSSTFSQPRTSPVSLHQADRPPWKQEPDSGLEPWLWPHSLGFPLPRICRQSSHHSKPSPVQAHLLPQGHTWIQTASVHADWSLAEEGSLLKWGVNKKSPS